jgi:uncharacterized membrane protein
MSAAQVARYLYAAMLAGYFGLLLLLTLWNTVVNPPVKLPVAIMLMLAVTPLLLPLRGVLHGRLKSCAWAAYLSLPYFFHGVTELASEPIAAGTLFDVLEVMFSLMLFFGGSFYIRYAARINA